MKATAAFLTSSIFGFILNFLAGLAAAAFGILGIGAKIRDHAGASQTRRQDSPDRHPGIDNDRRCEYGLRL